MWQQSPKVAEPICTWNALYLFLKPLPSPLSLPFSLCVCLSLSLCLPLPLSLCLSVCLSLSSSLSVCLTVCLSVCLSVSPPPPSLSLSLPFLDDPGLAEAETLSVLSSVLEVMGRGSGFSTPMAVASWCCSDCFSWFRKVVSHVSIWPSQVTGCDRGVMTLSVQRSHDDNNNHIQRHNSRFLRISSLCRELSPTCMLKWPGRNHVQIISNTESAYHGQNVALRAMWYERTAQLLSLTELKLHLFELYFIGWTINRCRREGNRSTRRKPLATSFRKCHILKPEDLSPKQASNLHNSIGGRLGKQTC